MEKLVEYLDFYCEELGKTEMSTVDILHAIACIQDAQEILERHIKGVK